MGPHDCSRFHRCSVNLCPLDANLELREWRKDDPRPFCPFIIDLLDPDKADTPYMEEVAASRAVWESKIGIGNLDNRVESRRRVREYFADRRAKEAD